MSGDRRGIEPQPLISIKAGTPPRAVVDEATVHDLFQFGVIVRTEGTAQLELCVGAIVVVTLSVEGDAVGNTKARVQRIDSVGDEYEIALDLRVPDVDADSRMLVPSDVHRLLNRRGYVRIAPDASEPVATRIEAQGHSHNAKLVDLSLGGARVVVSTTFEFALRGAAEVVLHLDLPEIGASRLPSRVRRRTLVEGCEVRYGIAFDKPLDDGPNEDHERVRAYVMRRQSEILEERLGPPV